MCTLLYFNNKSSSIIFDNLHFFASKGESEVDYRLIPSASSAAGCPTHSSYREKFRACSCEPHCSWDLCRLVEKPADCLQGPNIEWKWENKLYAWIAQMGQGMKTFLSVKGFDI